MINQDNDKIKVSLTIDRYLAEQLESAIEIYLSHDPEPEEDDTQMVEDMRKVQSVFARAYQRNKAIK